MSDDPGDAQGELLPDPRAEGPADPQTDGRAALVRRWFALTRDTMPSVAGKRGWPVRFDHCFQRILLDNACGARWTDRLKRPAYAHAPDTILRAAIALGEDVMANRADLWSLDENSLSWRGKPVKRMSRMPADMRQG